MSEQQDLLKTFESAVRDVLNNPKIEVTSTSTLFDDLGLESIDLLDLSCDLEKSLGRELDFKDMFKKISDAKGVSAKQVTVGDIVILLEGKNA